MERYRTDGTIKGDNKTIKQVFEKYPEAIIISGNDDWYAPIHYSPNQFIRKLGFGDQIIAEISLICDSIQSGCVLHKKQWNKIKKEYKKLFDINIEHLTVYTAQELAITTITS